MFLIGDPERCFIPVGDKVRDEKHNRPAAAHRVQVIQRRANISPGRARLVLKHFLDNAPDVAAPFFGRDISFHMVAENNQSHFVITLDGGKREH